MKVLHCDLRWVNEIHPFKKVIPKSFKNNVEVVINLKCSDFAIPSLIIIITFHNTFRIFLCVNNTEK
jgi:hypothetical protein